jgi:AcrR family transcriptional regulator
MLPDEIGTTGKLRSSSVSKEALFQAARTLFGQHGYKQTTIRQIGELAGVDASLIARYFGSKADLYVAVVVADRMDDQDAASAEGIETPYRDAAHVADALVRRSDEHGLGPIILSLIQLDTSAEIRDAARDRVARRLVRPLAEQVPDGVGEAGLRAEIAVSTLLGVMLARSLGWFDEIQTASRKRLVELVDEAMAGVLDGDGPEEDRAGS